MDEGKFKRTIVELPVRDPGSRIRLWKSFYVRLYEGLPFSSSSSPTNPCGELPENPSHPKGTWLFLLEMGSPSPFGWWIAENAAVWRGFKSVDVLPKYRKKLSFDEQGNPLPETENPLKLGVTELIIPIRDKKGRLQVPEFMLPPEPEISPGYLWRYSLTDPQRRVMHLLREDVLTNFHSQRSFQDPLGALHVFDEMRNDHPSLYEELSNYGEPSEKQEPSEKPKSEEPKSSPDPLDSLFEEEEDDLWGAATTIEDSHALTSEESPGFGFDNESLFEEETPETRGPLGRLQEALEELEKFSVATKEGLSNFLLQVVQQLQAISSLKKETDEIHHIQRAIHQNNLQIRRLGRLLIHSPHSSEEEIKKSCELLTRAYIGRVLREEGLTGPSTLSEETNIVEKKRTIAGNVRREICEQVRRRSNVDITSLRQRRNEGKKDRFKVRYIDVAQSVGLLWMYYEELRTLCVGSWRLFEQPVLS